MMVILLFIGVPGFITAINDSCLSYDFLLECHLPSLPLSFFLSRSLSLPPFPMFFRLVLFISSSHNQLNAKKKMQRRLKVSRKTKLNHAFSLFFQEMNAWHQDQPRMHVALCAWNCAWLMNHKQNGAEFGVDSVKPSGEFVIGFPGMIRECWLSWLNWWGGIFFFIDDDGSCSFFFWEPTKPIHRRKDKYISK